LHVNALIVTADGGGVAPSPRSARRLEIFGAALDTTAALGGVAQINHPNFHYAADAELLVELAGRGAALLEVANEAVDSNNAGDAAHPSTEALWDAVLSAGAVLWGVATDDAHHYEDAEAVRARGELAHVGDRGWIVVRATRDAADIARALRAGHFYASTGVWLDRVETDADGALVVRVAPGSPGEHEIVFIGRGGARLAAVRGREARQVLPLEAGGYVRAVVRDARGKKAWTQPFGPLVSGTVLPD
jgi:hypothetical protein